MLVDLHGGPLVVYGYRRLLKMSPQARRALPWWEVRLYDAAVHQELTGEEPKEWVDDAGLAALGVSMGTVGG